MDNLGSHRRSAIRRPRAARAKLFFLPKYSPDLKPIEMLFLKAQARLAQRRKTFRAGRLQRYRQPPTDRLFNPLR